MWVGGARWGSGWGWRFEPGIVCASFPRAETRKTKFKNSHSKQSQRSAQSLYRLYHPQSLTTHELTATVSSAQYFDTVVVS